MSRRRVSVAAANAAAAALTAAMLLASCSSSPEPEVFSMPDYTAAGDRPVLLQQLPVGSPDFSMISVRGISTIR